MTESFIGFYLLQIETERARDEAVKVATDLAQALRELHATVPDWLVNWNRPYKALRAYDNMMGKLASTGDTEP